MTEPVNPLYTQIGTPSAASYQAIMAIATAMAQISQNWYKVQQLGVESQVKKALAAAKEMIKAANYESAATQMQAISSIVSAVGSGASLGLTSRMMSTKEGNIAQMSENETFLNDTTKGTTELKIDQLTDPTAKADLIAKTKANFSKTPSSELEDYNGYQTRMKTEGKTALTEDQFNEAQLEAAVSWKAENKTSLPSDRTSLSAEKTNMERLDSLATTQEKAVETLMPKDQRIRDQSLPKDPPKDFTGTKEEWTSIRQAAEVKVAKQQLLENGYTRGNIDPEARAQALAEIANDPALKTRTMNNIAKNIKSAQDRISTTAQMTTQLSNLVSQMGSGVANMLAASYQSEKGKADAEAQILRTAADLLGSVQNASMQQAGEAGKKAEEIFRTLAELMGLRTQ